MAQAILGFAATMGALPPVPRRYAPERHAGQTDEQCERALRAADMKRAGRRFRNLRLAGLCALCHAPGTIEGWRVAGFPILLCAVCNVSLRNDLAHDACDEGLVVPPEHTECALSTVSDGSRIPVPKR